MSENLAKLRVVCTRDLLSCNPVPSFKVQSTSIYSGVVEFLTKPIANYPSREYSNPKLKSKVLRDERAGIKK